MVVFLAAFPFLAAVGSVAGPHESDLKLIQGKWILTQIQVNGRDTITSKKGRQQKALIKDDQIFFDDELLGVISLDPKKTPKELNAIVNKKLLKGIYNLEKDTLLICWPDVQEADRPTEFKTSPRLPVRLLTLKRVAVQPEKKEPSKEFTNELGMKFVWIPPGTFVMGSTNEEQKAKGTWETRHEVTLTKGYYLGAFEVAQREWVAVMGDNPSRHKGDSLPVEMVSWHDCQAFLKNWARRMAAHIVCQLRPNGNTVAAPARLKHIRTPKRNCLEPPGLFLERVIRPTKLV